MTERREPPQNIVQGATSVASGVTEAFRQQPGLLFLTIVNLAFLVFVYFLGTLVLNAYQEEQKQIHERYQLAITTVNRCVEVGLRNLEMKLLEDVGPDQRNRRNE